LLQTRSSNLLQNGKICYESVSTGEVCHHCGALHAAVLTLGFQIPYMYNPQTLSGELLFKFEFPFLSLSSNKVVLETAWHCHVICQVCLLWCRASML